MKVGSLFSGIGGLDLGLERAGMNVVWQAENEPYASKVLARHWPDVPNLGDVTEVDWDDVEVPDLVCGGFPCQPVSYAGSRRAQDDERWLWPEFARCLRALRPRYVLMENVPGLLTAGFDDILAFLHEDGFDAEWSVVSACSVGAPHTRERLFVVAYTDTSGRFRWPGQLGTSGRDQSSNGSRWPAEPAVDRVAARAPHVVDRVATLGNPVVPQVAELIGRAILEADAA